jgi:hypothetical protein
MLPMLEADAVADSLEGAFVACRRETAPYRHWLLDNMLPAGALSAIDTLPYIPPAIDDTYGKRETHNSTRSFFSANARARFPVCEALADALQRRSTVDALQALCRVDLTLSHLRIEYCLDTNGFWLEPHTDIGAKLFTMLIYLSDDPGSEAWGTDIYDRQMQLVGQSRYARNAGLIFIPAADTWHGFAKRPIHGVRRSLIVNYVKPEWRSRHELAYPDRLAGT